MYHVDMDFIKPRALREGDTVGIFAPSDWFSRRHFDEGIRVIKGWGLKVKYGKHIFERVDDFMAGTREQRAEDLRSMIFDEEVNALWAAEGGYAAPEIRSVLGEREIEHLRKNPKWLIGYSDVGVFTNGLFAKGIASIVGPNIWGLTYWKPGSIAWLHCLLFGNEISFPEKGEVIIPGEAAGRLLVSNLDSLIANLGTKYDPILHGDDNIILVVEDWKQNWSTLARQFEAVFDHEKFDRIAGLVLGRFSLMMEESYPKWAKRQDLVSLVREKLLRRGSLPLVSIDYFGHPSYWHYNQGKLKEDNFSLPAGILVSLSASKRAKISWLERPTG